MKRGTAGICIAAAAFVAAYSVWGPANGPARDAPVAASPAPERPPAPAAGAVTAHGVAEQPPASGEPEPRQCTLVTHYLPNADGTTTEAISCEPNEAEPEHPYANYPNAALESLAYADAAAAEILSMRLRETDSEVAMSLALRAAALAGGDATPIVAFGNAYPQPTAVNGVPVRRTVHVRYVLGTVTQLLDDPRHSVPYFEAIIRQHSTDPNREIALLDARAQQMIEEMRQIQLEVTGSSTIGG
jgi:hypothetical protein